MSLSNYHTHTLYCDGKDSPEELVREALRLGCPELGFSGHAYVPFDDCCMTRQGTLEYQREIRTLQEKYRDQIKIYLGIEQDFDSPLPTDPYDFVIGSVHYLYKDGVYLSVDEGRNSFIRNVQEHFGGDYYAFAEAYYEKVAAVYEQTRCTIVGHFDLVTKFNEDDALFDTGHPRYRAAVMQAIGTLCPAPVLFEINTGAMSRGYRKTPYPAPFILRELEMRGARFLLSSDCHDKRNLLYGLEAFRHTAKGIQERLFP